MQIGSYRISIDTAPLTSRAGVTRDRMARRGFLGGGIALALILGTAPYAFAANSGSVTATIYAQAPSTYSITVGPSAISFCSVTSPLTYPDGSCGYGHIPGSGSVTGGVTITNTGAAGHIDVNGADAVPSDNVTSDNWTLCGSSCDGPTEDGLPAGAAPQLPGPNQFELDTESNTSVGFGPVVLNAPQCDTAFTGSTNACSATTGQSQDEAIGFTGPSSTTDTSSTFSTTITWTAGP
jgi:hypothetical protein